MAHKQLFLLEGLTRHQPNCLVTSNAEHLSELMIVGPITVRSACSHHFCPVIGKVWIGVMPNEHTNVIGLSNMRDWQTGSWVVHRFRKRLWCSSRTWYKKRHSLTDWLWPLKWNATHYCMSWRGVKDPDSRMINSVMRGAFWKTLKFASRILVINA